MKSATRVLAMIAMGGGMAGGAMAVSQVPAPQSATTVAVSGPGATEAVQQLADESAQLRVAIASAQTQLAAAPSASSDLADLLSKADSQLAIARQRLAVDEALLAKLQAVGQVQHATPVVPTPKLAPTDVNGRPAPSDARSTSPVAQQPAEPTATTAPPTRQRTSSPSARPTNRGGDD